MTISTVTSSISESQLEQLTLASTDGVGTDPDPSVYLTPDALMEYCQTCLSGIDSQVDTYMDEQENVNAEQSGIQGILSQIQTDSAAIGSSGSINDPTTCQNLEQSLEDLISQIQVKDPGSPALGELETLHDTIMATGTGPYTTTGPDGSTIDHQYYNNSGSAPGSPPNGPAPPSSTTQTPDNTIDATEFQGFTTTLTGLNTTLGQNSQLQMIQIQSLMSDRTTAIQLTTNIMQAFDDGTSKIVANVGQG